MDSDPLNLGLMVIKQLNTFEADMGRVMPSVEETSTDDEEAKL